MVLLVLLSIWALKISLNTPDLGYNNYKIRKGENTMKLFDVLAPKHQEELFHFVLGGIKTAVDGKSDQFFYNIDYYLEQLPQIRASMAQQARVQILEYFETYGWKGNRNDAVDALNDNYLSIFQTLEDYVNVGIDMEADGFPSALYTRSLETLMYLYKAGLMEKDTDSEKMLAGLVGNKTALSLKEGNFVTVRLDVVGIKNGNPIFKPVTPKSNLDIGGGKRFVIIPVPFMYLMDGVMSTWFADSPFRFVKSSAIGQVTHIAAIGQDVVRKAYEGNTPSDIESKLRKVRCGYDVAKQRFLAYDLEASLSSTGIASFRPEMLDSLAPVYYEEIDKSRYNIDFSLLRGIFKTRVNNAKVAQLDSLLFIILTGFATLKDKAQAVITASERETDKALYYLMKNNPELFGDIDEALEKRERMIPKFLKTFQVVELPELEEDRVKLLTEMLANGVIKFTATSKSGSVFERSGTSSKQILERMLGKDYVKDFESIRNKLYHVKDLLKNGAITNRTELETVAVGYNLLDYVDQEVFFADNIDTGDNSSALSAVEAAIKVLIEKGANRKIEPSALLYRSIYATDPSEFFGNINVNNIISVDFAEL
jgi:hypothetical protein